MSEDHFDGWVGARYEALWPHLYEPGRLFVIEVIVPFDVSPVDVGFDEVDVASQISWSNHHWSSDGETMTAAPFRYVWPSELDLMARLAGMVLRERWADWDRESFTATSRSHVSVWQRAE